MIDVVLRNGGIIKLVNTPSYIKTPACVPHPLLRIIMMLTVRMDFIVILAG